MLDSRIEWNRKICMTLKAKLLEGQLCPVSCGAQSNSLPPLGCPVPSC